MAIRRGNISHPKAKISTISARNNEGGLAAGPRHSIHRQKEHSICVVFGTV
jgi:hypothetical protein